MTDIDLRMYSADEMMDYLGVSLGEFAALCYDCSALLPDVIDGGGGRLVFCGNPRREAELRSGIEDQRREAFKVGNQFQNSETLINATAFFTQSGIDADQILRLVWANENPPLLLKHGGIWVEKAEIRVWLQSRKVLPVSHRVRASDKAVIDHRDPTQLFLTSRQAAEVLSVHEMTLSRWRRGGSGPPFRRLGNARVVYPVGAFWKWVEAKTEMPR